MIDNAFQQILNGAGVHLIDVKPGTAAVVPDGFKLEDLEKYLPRPNRANENIKLHSTADFVAYVNRFKTDNSVIFIAPDIGAIKAGGALATAIIDYHQPHGEAEWGSHRVFYVPTPSVPYALLSELDGKLLGQDEFALRLRDLARYCQRPTSAELLEVVHTMTLTSQGQFASLSDDASGSVRLAYQVDVAAQAGTAEKRLTVPRTLSFRLPVFVGGDEVDVEADFLFRIPKQPGGAVLLGIRLPERRWLETEIARAMAERIRGETDLLVLVGQK